MRLPRIALYTVAAWRKGVWCTGVDERMGVTGRKLEGKGTGRARIELAALPTHRIQTPLESQAACLGLTSVFPYKVQSLSGLVSALSQKQRIEFRDE